MAMEPKKKEIIKELITIIKERTENDSEDPETILTDLQEEGFEVEDIKVAFEKHKLM